MRIKPRKNINFLPFHNPLTLIKNSLVSENSSLAHYASGCGCGSLCTWGKAVEISMGSDLEELLSEAKRLPRLQQARVAAILGSLVADAAGKSR